MTQQNADLPNTHGGVRTVINANADDAETRLAKADKLRGGFADFNDSATSVTPISFDETSGWVLLTNDKLGEFTQIVGLPEGVTTSLFASNQFNFTELSLYDMLNIRLDITVTTTSPNQLVETRLNLAYGDATQYSIPFTSQVFKTAGAQNINRFNGVYMGNNETLNNPARFEISSDASATVVVNGWYVQCLLRGEAS